MLDMHRWEEVALRPEQPCHRGWNKLLVSVDFDVDPLPTRPWPGARGVSLSGGVVNQAEQLYRAIAEYVFKYGEPPSMICVNPLFDAQVLLHADIYQWMNLDLNAPPRATFAGIPYAVLPEQVTEFLLEDA